MLWFFQRSSSIYSRVATDIDRDIDIEVDVDVDIDILIGPNITSRHTPRRPKQGSASP